MSTGSFSSRRASGGPTGGRRFRLLWLAPSCLVVCASVFAVVFLAPADAARQEGEREGSDKAKKEKQRKEADGPRYGAKPPSVDAKTWILIDGRDGEVLAARSAESERMIASTTKMMTAYVASQLFEPRDVVRVPGYRGSPGESLAGLQGGDRISVRDLLYALLLPSGNDAAYAVSRIKPFSEKRFVAEMNASARSLGLVHTNFSTPIGLDERGNYSSARDLAELARAVLGVPLLAKIVDTESRTVRSGTRKLRLLNRNNLVLSKPWVSGVKTGYTSSAGYNLVAAGTRDNTTLISVVLGSPNEAVRNAASLELLGWGFSRYRREVPVSMGEQVVTSGLDYRDARTPLVAAETLPILARDVQEVRVEADSPDEIVGPVAKGQRVGRVTVTVDGEPAATAPLITGAAAPAATLGEKVRTLALSPLILIPIGLVLLLVGIILIFRNRSRRGDNANLQS